MVMVRSGHGLVLRSLKRLTEARAELERGVAQARRLYRGPHPALATIINNLALVAQDQNDYDAAESLFREVLSIDRAMSTDNRGDIAYDLNNLGWFLFSRRGRHAEGEQMIREALAIRRQLLGPSHPLTAQAMRVLADARQDLGHPADAVPLYRDAAKAQRAALPRGHRQTIQSLEGLARALLALKRPAEAETVLREALADLEAAGPSAKPRIPSIQALLTRAQQAKGRDRR
jgi:tetratricopeptide (TPR) repeat protein